MPAKQSVPKTKPVAETKSVDEVKPVATKPVAETKHAKASSPAVVDAPAAKPAKASKPTKVVAAPVEDVHEEAEPVEAAAPRKRAPRKAAAKAEVVPEVEHETVEGDATVEHDTKTRVVPTADTVHAEFTELLTELEQQIAQLRDSSDKTGSAKYLRGILRRVKTLQTSFTRVMRRRQPTKRVNNNSGFLKPVEISPAIAKFTGLDPTTLHSRVDVTKRVCDYIKEKNLQNPSDKRQIVADAALSKILDYNAESAEKPLTYYHIQTLLKTHFVPTKKE